MKLLGKKIDQNNILKESFCSKMNEGPKYYKEKCKRLWNGPKSLSSDFNPKLQVLRAGIRCPRTMGQIRPVACFWTSLELWMAFIYFLKVVKQRRTKPRWIRDKVHVCPQSLNYLLSYPSQKKFDNPCSKGHSPKALNLRGLHLSFVLF